MDRALLNRATSSDQDPPPGYLLREIVQMTHSSPLVCQQIEAYLLKKLQRDEAMVKFKVLRVIRHVCEKGRPEFRRNIARNSESVRQCQNFTGPTDRFSGNARSEAVRNEAQLCLKAIFSDLDQLNDESNSMSKRIQGFGAGTHDVPNKSVEKPYQPSTMQNSRDTHFAGMQGFGNPNFNHSKRPTKSENAIKIFSESANKYLPDSVKSKLQKFGIPLENHERRHYNANEYPYGGTRPENNSFRAEPRNNFSEYTGNKHTEISGMDRADEWRNNAFLESSKSSLPKEYTSPGEYEKALVTELLSVRDLGISAITLRKEFVEKCNTLNAEPVASQLVYSISSSLTIAQKKTLFAVLESLISPNCEKAHEYRKIFKITAIVPLQKSHGMNILDKRAKRIIKMLEEPEEETAAVTNTECLSTDLVGQSDDDSTQKNNASSTSVNSLNILSMDSSADQNTFLPYDLATADDTVMNIFGQSSDSNTSVTAGTDLFGGMEISPKIEKFSQKNDASNSLVNSFVDNFDSDIQLSSPAAIDILEPFDKSPAKFDAASDLKDIFSKMEIKDEFCHAISPPITGTTNSQLNKTCVDSSTVSVTVDPMVSILKSAINDFSAETTQKRLYQAHVTECGSQHDQNISNKYSGSSHPTKSDPFSFVNVELNAAKGNH